MPEFEVVNVASMEELRTVWDELDETTARMRWQLLGRLSEEELLIELPEWLAEEKITFTDGSTPTVFVGRIAEETEKAIRFADATDARPLQRLAHRIAKLEEGIRNVDDEQGRRFWLEERLDERRRKFNLRGLFVGLQDEWLPKSQIRKGVRRVDPVAHARYDR